jgi:uncharacterized peroxidase-related enzyme
MPRIAAIDPAAATGRTKDLLDDVHRTFGATPNLFRTAAASLATLESMLRQFQILGGGAIDKGLGEQIALAVAQANGCSYCLSAHTAIGKLYGVSEEELDSSRAAVSADSRKQAALEFAQAVALKRGAVTDMEFARARAAGWSDSELAEILAHVGLNVFTNYYAIATQMEIDWPVVRVGEAKAA